MLFVEGNAPLSTVTDIKSFEFTAQLEIIKEGYLGETTDRRDSVYRGYSGKVEVNFENRDVIDLSRRIIDKARRRTPGARVNLKATLNFPDADKVRVILKDLEFGAIPMNFGSRTDYGTISLDFEGADYSII